MSFLGYKFKILKASQVPFEYLQLGEITIYVPNGDVQTAARIAESLLVAGDANGKFRVEADGNADEILEFGTDINLNFDFADTEVLVNTAKRVQSEIAFKHEMSGDLYVFGRRYIEAVIQVACKFGDISLKTDSVKDFGGDLKISEPAQTAKIVFDTVKEFSSAASFRMAVVVTQNQVGAEHIESETAVPSPKVVLIGRVEDGINIQTELADKITLEAVFGMLGETILADFDENALSDMNSKTLADLRFKTLI